ncbi:MAG TPA: hypothetical protein ENK99_07000 [Campylobacterales bacterium]|nr:hypothetical protein [Campylobacterales bacterium]
MSYITINEGTDKIFVVIQNTDYLQRLARDTGEFYFQFVLSNKTSGAESYWFDVSNLEYIYIKTLFANSTDTVNIRIGYLDTNNEVVYSDEYTIANTGILVDTTYPGEMLEINTLGWNEIKIRMTSSPSNNVEFYVGGLSNSVDLTYGYVFVKTNNFQFNAQTNTWATKTSKVDAFSQSTASIILNKGYCLCGSAASGYGRDCDEYNSDTDSWTSKTDTPSPGRQALGSSNIRNKIYIYKGYVQ